MEKIQLGNSELKVSRMTLGCWSFGGGEGSYWGAQKQDDVNALAARALDLGINFFDTAVAYNSGESETALGKALKGKRGRAVICDKLMLQDTEGVKNYEKTLREMLVRLQTDYIDMLMIHWPGDAALVRANLEALLRAREKGMIREIGVSNFGTDSMKMAREMGVNIVANEFGYNLMCRGIEKKILPYCLENRIDILAYSPLMQGVLTGKYRKVADIPLSRRRTVHFSKMDNPDCLHGGPGADAEVESLVAGLAALSEKTGISSGALALAWVYGRKGVSCVIAGCRSVEQLDENIASLETKVPEDVLNEITTLSQPLFDKVGNYLDIYRGEINPRVW